MADTPHLRRLDATHVRQAWDTMTDNDLRLERRAAAEVVSALNADVSGLYILFNQVRKHRWLAEGSQLGPLQDFLADAADRLTEMTDDLAIRVHALGGVPVCGPMGMRQHAPMGIEAPHQYDIRSSLGRDLEGYATLAALFRDHIELAARVGDNGTAELLSDHLTTLEDDADTLAQWLDGDTLVQR